MKNFDEEEWARTKGLLRKGLTAPQLEHPDFVNSRVLEEIGRVAMPKRPVLLPLRWLVWSGIAAIFCAALLTMLFLPRGTGRRSDSEFISQVVSARAETPQLSVSEFRIPNERGVVIWIEGADYIPAENSVR
jgi:hypothetical protein